MMLSIVRRLVPKRKRTDRTGPDYLWLDNASGAKVFHPLRSRGANIAPGGVSTRVRPMRLEAMRRRRALR
jgi:hypothetical protein